MIRSNPVLLLLILLSAFDTAKSSNSLEHLSFGICQSFGPDVNLSIPEDLLSTVECGLCSDIFDNELVGEPHCEENPCDGLICFNDRFVLSEEGPNNPVFGCVKDGYMDYTCDGACESLCVPFCDILSQRRQEEDLVTCGYDLFHVGDTGTFVTGLCTGSVPLQFCDNAVPEDRTCFVGKVEKGQDILDTTKCAPVSYTGHKDAGRYREYWACPMNVKITGVVKIYEIRPEYCAILERSYGEEMITFVNNSDSEDAGGRLSSWIAQL
jgi:hypothetical protein